jgi:hypothetical protein
MPLALTSDRGVGTRVRVDSFGSDRLPQRFSRVSSTPIANGLLGTNALTSELRSARLFFRPDQKARLRSWW